MALYEIKAPDGRTYQIEGPANATQRQVEAEVMRQHPMAAMNTEELENSASAPASLGNFARETGQGVASGIQTLTDLFGANNAASKYLGGVSKSLQEGLTPERKHQMEVEQELSERAKGNILDEITTGFKNVARHPFTSVAQGLGSSVPLIAGTVALPEELGLAATVGIGSLMGLGGQKGQNYQTVHDEAISRGMSEEQADKLGQQAQEYNAKNLASLGIGAGTGALEGALGFAPILGKFLRPESKAAEVVTPKPNLKPPTFKRALGESVLESGGTEFIQGAGAQIASNMALQDAGFDTPLMEGALGAGAHDALVGALTGAAVSPAQLSNMKTEYDANKIKEADDQRKENEKRLAEEAAAKQAEVEKAFAEAQARKQQQEAQIAKTKEDLGLNEKPLALPAPAEKVEPGLEADPLKNPVGNLTKQELGPEVSKYIDTHRKETGKPPLKSYSIEDIHDALPGVNPEGEKAAVDSIIAAKTGYGGEVYTPQDVLNIASQKNVETGTKGFTDFLTRATGTSNLDEMSPPQLHSAFQALRNLPETEEKTVLPEGTNASRFTQKQYDNALKVLPMTFEEIGTSKLGVPDVLNEIKDATNLTSDSDAQALLDHAVREGDLERIQTPRFETRTADDKLVSSYKTRKEAEAAAAKKNLNVTEGTIEEVGLPSKATMLPEGHEIREEQFKESEQPAGYEILAGDKTLGLTFKTEDEANNKIESLKKGRAAQAANIQGQITKEQNTLKKGEAELTKLEAAGEAGSTEYAKKKAAHSVHVKEVEQKIADLEKRRKQFDINETPLSVSPVGLKPVTRTGHTVYKNGKAQVTLPTRQAAEEHIVANMSDKELKETASNPSTRSLNKRARAELNRRQGNEPKGIKVQKSKLPPEPKVETKTEPVKDTSQADALRKVLEPLMQKFGLGKVKLEIPDNLADAEGSYLGNLMKVALDNKDPIGVLRHESIHALKDLGFFSDNQWNALRRMAKDKWIQQYLKDVPYSEGKSRYDAYMDLYKGDMAAIEEEAIADAFRNFKEAGSPPGMIAAIMKRLNDFFEALRNSLNNAGFQTAEDIFGKAERGELREGVAKTNQEKFSFKQQNKILPKEPGTEPIKEGYVRLYHQTDGDNLKQIEKEGLLLEHAKGIEGPKAIYAGEKPFYGEASDRPTLEFQVPKKDWDSPFVLRNVKPEDFIAAHYPWHKTARYLEDKEGIANVLSGRFDDFDSKTDEGKAVQYIKDKYSNKADKESFEPSIENGWKADDAEIEKADAYEEKNGIRPYVSEGRLDLPTRLPKLSIKTQDKYGFDPVLNVPVNKDGTVTVYYHTTLDQAKVINQSKKILSNDKPRIYVTNESNGAPILANRGNFDQELDGSTVMLNIDPSLLHLDEEYDNGRKDFFIPMTQGEFFDKKMRMSSIQAARDKAITEEFSVKDHQERIKKAIDEYNSLDKKGKQARVKAARKVLKDAHNVTTLMTENGKLERTRLGDYDISYEGNSVASMGLGLASAQKITDKFSSCNRSAICEGLCLGETSGGNLMYGGAAAEDVNDIKKSSFRAGARMSQYLKTEALIIHPEEFAVVLQREIDSLKDWAKKPTEVKTDPVTKVREKVEKQIYDAAVRLNVTSDFEGKMWEGIIKSNPDVKFYDYTKLNGQNPIAENHHLTYSSTGFGQVVNGEKIFFKNKAGQYDHNWNSMKKRLDDGYGVAMAFSSKNELPKFLYDTDSGKTYHVWDGDNYDARFMDPTMPDGTGVIVGLRNKAGNLKESTSTKETGGFFVNYDPKTDGDTVVVPSQAQFKGTIPIAKLSLKAPETKEFKRFFGDSKVVDKDGKPMVMYHATNADFNTFKRSEDGKLGEGIYSTSIPDYANEFAPKGNIMPLFVNAENPFVIDVKRGDKPMTDRFSGDINKAMVKAVEDFTNGKTRLMDLEGNQVRELFEKNGYDGIMVKDDQGNIVEVNAFTPNQLKSAIGNTGEYNFNKPDIRYSLSDRVKNIPNISDIDARVDTTTHSRNEVGHAQRMISAINPDTFSKLRQRFFNRYQRLGEFDKRLAKMKGMTKLMADTSAESAALLSDLASGVAAKALGLNGKGGVPVFNNGAVTVDTSKKGPVEIFAPLAKLGDPRAYQYYQFWAGVNRGSRYMQNPNGKYVEQNFEPADVAKAAALEKEFPEFKDIQKEWTEYNNGLVKFLVDTGVLSKEKAELFTKYSDYIPFYRQFDDQETIGPKLFQSMSNVKAPKAAKGGEAPLADFLETIVRNTQSSIQAGMKTVAGQRAINNALELQEAEQVNYRDRSGVDVVAVFDKGELKYYRVADPLYMEAMKGLNLPEIPFLGIFAKPANLLRNMVTKDPGFMMANMLKDSIQTYITSGSNITPITSTFSEFTKGLTGAGATIEKLRSAGLGGGRFTGDIVQSGKDLAKQLRKEAGAKNTFEKVTSPVTSLWDALEKGTEASDLATRAAVYDKVMKETGNEAEALFQALETMNFYRKGNSAIIRILTAVTPFLNARMQGLDVFYRAGFAPTFKRLTGAGDQVTADDLAKQKTFMIRSAGVLALSVAYWALTHDDDDYKKQEQETRDNNWLIPSLGIKIPTPFEVGFLFKVLPERIMNYYAGTDTGADFMKSMGRGVEQTFGLQFPQAVAPLVEASVNYSMFTGRAIVPTALQNVAPEYQVDANTSVVAEEIGKALGKSPILVDHVIKGYTGTMGMYAMDLVDAVLATQGNSPKASKRFEQMPIIKRFALDPDARGTITSYYDLKDHVDEAVRTINLLEKTQNYEELTEYTQEHIGDLANREYVKQMDKQMKKLQDDANAIRNSPLDPDTKRDLLKMIGESQNALTANTQYLKKMMTQL